MSKRKAQPKTEPVAAPDEAAFLVAIQKDQTDANVRVAYADWLDEHDRPYEAAVQRDRAGVSEVWYMIRCKTTGKFANPDGPGRDYWTRVGKRWRSLKSLVPHVLNSVDRGRYASVKMENLEIVVIEVRPQTVCTLQPVSSHDPRYPHIKSFAVPEPVAPKLPAEAIPPPTQPERRATRARRR